MKSLLLCFFSFVFVSLTHAQSIQNVDVFINNNRLVQVEFELEKTTATQTIQIKASLNDGKTYTITPGTITGDIGVLTSSSLKKVILWNINEDLGPVSTANLGIQLFLNGNLEEEVLFSKKPTQSDDIALVDVPEVLPSMIGGLPALYAVLEYPSEARKKSISGRVILDYLVDEKGQVSDIKVIQSPNKLLEKAAIQAMSAMKFTPGLDMGRPVKVRMMQQVLFKLDTR